MSVAGVSSGLAAEAAGNRDPLRDAQSSGRVDEVLQAALAAARESDAPETDRAQMLMEIAMGLQQRPRTAQHLVTAVALYDEASSICPPSEALLRSRILARKGTALQAIPDEGTVFEEQARVAYEQAIPVLEEFGTVEETAEAAMNLGLVLQQLATQGRARMTDAISAYHRALRTFEAGRYPVEFAILQNNLATAYLSMPLTDERAAIREALAVRCFEEALRVVNIVEHPSEYAMLQNNLGNALQYAASSHAVENNLRALTAYDEALKVRTPATSPLEYANTVANKANCLWNLPDDRDFPQLGNARNLAKARTCYAAARDIFASHGELAKAEIISEALAELEQAIAAASRTA
jgi:tetratricopeptide (TPR) repeat protein